MDLFLAVSIQEGNKTPLGIYDNLKLAIKESKKDCIEISNIDDNQLYNIMYQFEYKWKDFSGAIESGTIYIEKFKLNES